MKLDIIFDVNLAYSEDLGIPTPVYFDTIVSEKVVRIIQAYVGVIKI